MASGLLRSRLQRLFISLSALAVTIIGVFVAWLFKGPNVVCASFIVVAIVLFLAYKTYVDYHNRTYDPTWILKFQSVFDEMHPQRKKAATTLIERKKDLTCIDVKRNELCSIDDVLDFLEDLGFYVKGGQISAEVAHHHFYHWIRGYWKTSRSYIEAWRRQEPTRWECVAELFEMTCAIEVSKTNRTRDAELESDDESFLTEEQELL